jgi:hypothetical protein
MPLPFEGYAPELKAVMDRAFENACAGVVAATSGKGSDGCPDGHLGHHCARRSEGRTRGATAHSIGARGSKGHLLAPDRT